MIDCGLNRFNTNVRLQEKTICLIAEMFAKTVEVDRSPVLQSSFPPCFGRWYGMMYDHQSNEIMTEILNVCMVNSLRCFRFGKGSSFHSSGTWWWFGSYCYLDFNDLAAKHMDRYHVKPTFNGPGHPWAPPGVGSLIFPWRMEVRKQQLWKIWKTAGFHGFNHMFAKNHMLYALKTLDFAQRCFFSVVC